MRVDELRRSLDEAARRDVDVVDARAAVGAKTARRQRRNHQLVGVVTVAVIAAIAIPIAALRDDPKANVRVGPQPSETVEGWSQVRRATVGLPAHASFNALASNDRALLLGGDRAGSAQIWYSEDGTAWSLADNPRPDPNITASYARTQVRAIATSGHTSLAIVSGTIGDAASVWRSDDDGRTWHAIAYSAGLFGPDALQMGRPFVDGLTYAHGKWIASGGGSSGYGAIWTSTDGRRWTQVLDTKPGPPNTGVGSVNVIDAGDGTLLAYGGNVTWESHDGFGWFAPAVASVPEPFFLQTVAPGATVAFGENKLKHGQPTPLLRLSTDGSWAVDATFLADFPDARVAKITHEDDVWIATGTSGSQNHPDAWISTDGISWRSMPASLYGSPGRAAYSGTLRLAATIRNRVVMFATTPELDRYYTYDLPKTIGSDAPSTTSASYLHSPPYIRGIEIGRTYDYSMYTHCGIDMAKIDGTWWRASPPQDDKDGNPPKGWGRAVGTLRIVTENKAVFTLGSGLSATYVRDNLAPLVCN